MRNNSYVALGLLAPTLAVTLKPGPRHLDADKRDDSSYEACTEYVDVVTYIGQDALDDFITITTTESGITEPHTTILLPEDGEPGTVLVDVPPSLSDLATTIVPSGESTPPVTSEEPPPPPSGPEPTSTEPESSTSTEPPGPTFSCDAGGYLIQRTTLYRLDLATGENRIVNDKVGPGGSINPLGYNVLDNFLYGFVSISGGQKQLIRIDAAGEGTVLDLKVPGGLSVGDVDDNGQFWVSAGGSRWQQVDLKPGSSTYATVVDEGTTSPGAQVADWVYLENGGDYLYSIKLGANAIGARWSRTTHSWETLDNYGKVTSSSTSGFGALYAVGNDLYGSDNQSGDIIDFPVLQSGATYAKVADGPATSSNDGARCYLAPNPRSPTAT